MEFIKVTIRSNTIEIPKGSNLLVISQEAPKLIPFRCKQGICGTCKVKVISGLDNLSLPTTEEKEFLQKLNCHEPDIRLACQVKAINHIKIEPFGYTKFKTTGDNNE